MDLFHRHESLRAAATDACELTQFLNRQIPDTHDAQDLMQELYLALLKVPDCSTERQPKAYLFEIAGKPGASTTASEGVIQGNDFLTILLPKSL
jgi:hypothetical protein